MLPVTCATVAHLAPANARSLPGEPEPISPHISPYLPISPYSLPGEPEPTPPRTRAHRAAAGALSALALLVRPTAALLLVPATALWLVLPSRAVRLSHGDAAPPPPSPPPLPSPSARREAREAQLSSRLLWLGGGAALEASVVRLEALASGGAGARAGGGGAGGGLATAKGAAPPLPCEPPEGWARCEDGGFVRVRGSDERPLAAAAPPRGTPSVAQLEQLEALVSRLEATAAGPPVRAALRRAWRRALALTPCAVAGVAVTLAGFGIDRLCYGRWVFVWRNFLAFNLLSSGPDYYGTHPPLWYFTHAFPALLALHAPLLVAGARQAEGRRALLAAVLLAAAALSRAAHKELRFLYPLLPLLHGYAGLALSRMPPRRRHAHLLLLAAANLPVALYLGRWHGAAPIAALAALRHAAVRCASPPLPLQPPTPHARPRTLTPTPQPHTRS